MWYDGLLQLTIWQTVAATLLLTHITILSVTIYLHRFSAHRALELHAVLQHFFRFWLWLTTAMNTREWTAVHRKHHARCETPDDPHSPVQKSLRVVLLQGAELYRQEANNSETIKRYGQNCPDDWVEHNLYSRFQTLGVGLMLIVNLLLFGVIGISVWAIQMLWIPLLAAGVINGIGHCFGYRSFECHDNAHNILPWGILIGGEELHNNHHTYPNSARLSVRRWEFDIGWFWIRVLAALKLANVRSSGPLVHRQRGKQDIDKGTVQAVINNRFQVMAYYRKYVIAPMVRAEWRRVSGQNKLLLRRAKKLLSREHSLLKPVQLEKIDSIVEQYQALKIVYEKRLALQAIWNNLRCHNDRLHALREWCHQAEESGIKVLQEFAFQLRSYSLPNSST